MNVWNDYCEVLRIQRHCRGHIFLHGCQQGISSHHFYTCREAYVAVHFISSTGLAPISSFFLTLRGSLYDTKTHILQCKGILLPSALCIFHWQDILYSSALSFVRASYRAVQHVLSIERPSWKAVLCTLSNRLTSFRAVQQFFLPWKGIL